MSARKQAAPSSIISSEALVDNLMYTHLSPGESNDVFILDLKLYEINREKIRRALAANPIFEVSEFLADFSLTIKIRNIDLENGLMTMRDIILTVFSEPQNSNLDQTLGETRDGNTQNPPTIPSLFLGNGGNKRIQISQADLLFVDADLEKALIQAVENFYNISFLECLRMYRLRAWSIYKMYRDLKTTEQKRRKTTNLPAGTILRDSEEGALVYFPQHFPNWVIDLIFDLFLEMIEERKGKCGAATETQ